MVSLEFRNNRTLSCSLPDKGAGDRMSEGERMAIDYLLPWINCRPQLRVPPRSSGKQCPDQGCDSEK